MRLAGTLTLLFLSIATAASGSSLDPQDGAVLPENVAQQVLHQCSRAVPQNVTGTWLLTRIQVNELESRLPAALEAVASQHGSDYAQPRSFRRQYVGLISRGSKIIYVNAFPRNAADPIKGAPEEFQNQRDWHQTPIVVCDGGPTFFGVEYDPATKRFSHFEFNGVA